MLKCALCGRILAVEPIMCEDVVCMKCYGNVYERPIPDYPQTNVTWDESCQTIPSSVM
jgi:hypothetical protein